MKRFVTKGVAKNVSTVLQFIMWSFADNMPPPKDYLQVFRLEEFEGKK